MRGISLKSNLKPLILNLLIVICVLLSKPNKLLIIINKCCYKYKTNHQFFNNNVIAAHTCKNVQRRVRGKSEYHLTDFSLITYILFCICYPVSFLLYVPTNLHVFNQIYNSVIHSKSLCLFHCLSLSNFTICSQGKIYNTSSPFFLLHILSFLYCLSFLYLSTLQNL